MRVLIVAMGSRGDVARPPGWRRPPDLETFLNAGPAPVFVGFGSMSPDDAARVAGVAAAAARQAGVRLVLQAGRAGLAVAGPGDDSIVIGDVPHDWLFPQAAAVVQHAGAGTTGAGLRAGVPAVTVPMIGDQPFWAARVAALGAGPPPIRYRRLPVPVRTAAIQDAVTRPSYRDRAQALAGQLAREDSRL